MTDGGGGLRLLSVKSSVGSWRHVTRLWVAQLQSPVWEFTQWAGPSGWVCARLPDASLWDASLGPTAGPGSKR
ncbi:MAG: hypothetical protein Phyf2KO_06130 [Phycisphaerales bacterium]